MYKEQKRFTPIASGLAVLILLIVGVGGYYLFNNKEKVINYFNLHDQFDWMMPIAHNQQENIVNQEPTKITEKEVEVISSTLIEKDYSYPYPVSWKEDNMSFFLTGISIDKVSNPETFKKDSGGYYDKGDELNALTLILKVVSSEKGGCAELRIRRVINEYGDMVAPATDQFRFPGTGGCGIAENTFYENQKVVFVVPAAEKSFSITSGGNSKIFFTVNLLDADGVVRQKPDIQLEKDVLEEGLRTLYPYDADVLTSYDSSGREFATTGQSSGLQTWFIYGGAPRIKYYKVVPGKEILLYAYTDVSSCNVCVCNYPEFSLSEYKDGGFSKTKDFNFPHTGGIAEKIYYTPTSDRIKIEAGKGCFYLEAYQEGEAI